MRGFVATDCHAEVMDIPDCDLVLIAGDFSKGDKLRELVFGEGDIESAKTEIIETSAKFLESLPGGSIISPGNVEKPCLKEIFNMAEELGLYFLDNRSVNIKDNKIIGLSFFMEEWWTREAYPDDTIKIERAKKEEGEIKKFLEENKDADIVLSHLPPHGVLDSNINSPEYLPKSYPKNCGSKILLEYIKNNKPKLVICGHIHVQGEKMIGSTKVINPGRGRIVDLL
jgi:Icc-related predicted phosphoesterase